MAKKKLRQAIKKQIGFKIVNPYDLDPAAMHKYLYRLARMANNRLYRLEKAQRQDESYAYKEAMQELKRQNRRRYSYAANDVKGMIREIQRIESFIGKQSSTLTGLRELQSSAFQKLRLKYMKTTGLDITATGIKQKDFYRFLNSQTGKDLVHEYGSDDVIEDIIKTMFYYKQARYTFDDLIEEYGRFLAEEHMPLEAVELKRRGVIGSYGEYRDLRAKRKGI